MSENVKLQYILGYLGIGRNIILKWILVKWALRIWIGFILLRTWSYSCEHYTELPGSITDQRNLGIYATISCIGSVIFCRVILQITR